MIKSLYKDYFQKSRVFLYPALQIKRGVSVTPIETFVSWSDHYSKDDAKLICLYHLRDDKEFKDFEKDKLLNNKLFHDFTEVVENKGVYIFDYGVYQQDWIHFINGKYSKLSKELKRIIKGYIGINNPNMPYVESFLHPEKYFQMYSEIMDVDIALLQKVGELCSVPNLDKENLTISVKDLDFKLQIP